MTTILTGEPLGGNLFPGGTMKLNFGGSGIPGAAATGQTTRTWLGLPADTIVQQVRYPASTARNSITDGVIAFDRMVRGTEGQLLAFGHSQFCQVVTRWFTSGLADDADAADRLEILLIGNPLRKYGGYGVGRPEFDGRKGVATPNNTGYAVTDVKLQYDGWADTPTRPGIWAVANARQDRYGINGDKAIHAMGYRSAVLDDPARKTYTEGTTTYVMLPHAPLLPSRLQSVIERSYQRPES